MINSSPVDDFRSELTAIRDSAAKYFEGLPQDTSPYRIHDKVAVPVWRFVTDAQKATSQVIRSSVASFGGRLLEAVQSSPLLEEADYREVRQLLRKLSSALVLQQYLYSNPEIVTDDKKGEVIGMIPADHSENWAAPNRCVEIFNQSCARISSKLDLLAPSHDKLAGAIVATQVPNIHKYRPNTAFVIMQIDSKIPKLEDVKNCIKEVFKEFGIEAMRSDEIEHSDVITQRILDEIVTSEFLIADLTGERPSVYYELGYAHASGKRPILFREEGTRLHFDLLVHNVPEYRNTTDLRAKLRSRLSAILGKPSQ